MEHSRSQDNVSDRFLVRGLLAASLISEHHVPSLLEVRYRYRKAS